MQITDNKNSLKCILHYIEVCIILHNLLTQWHDGDDDGWIQDNFSDIDDVNRGPLDDDMSSIYLSLIMPEMIHEVCNLQSILEICT